MTPADKDAIDDFSIVLGGPLHRIFVATRLATPELDLTWRRAVVLSMIAWMPLAALTAIAGRSIGGVQLPFVQDFEAHIRLLVVLPLLVIGESVLHLRFRSVAAQFVERGIVADTDMARFLEYLASLRSARNSKIAELLLVLLVLGAGPLLWTRFLVVGGIAPAASSWFADRGGSALHLTLAGYWYVFCSIAIVHFLTLRLCFRLILWFRFLWRVSRLSLRFNPMHADRVGGLGFLGDSCLAFSTLLIAMGVIFAAMILTRIVHQGQSVLDFRYAIGFLILAPLVFFLAPLLVFSGRLVQARWRGRRNYGLLMSEYAQFFERKWIADPDQPRTELLGSSDIQSLSDMASSCRAAYEMRAIPVSRDAVIALLVASAAPYVPLALTVMPLDELVRQLVNLLL